MSATVLAWLLVSACGLYTGLGLLFGLAFVTRLAKHLDEAVSTSTVGFRLAILPGAVLLWPVLSYLLATGPRSAAETSHDRAVDA